MNAEPSSAGRLYLYDDAQARTFEPFALTRPMCELVAGTTLIRARWLGALAPDARAEFLAGERLRDFEESGASSAATGSIPPGSIIANARCVPALITALPDQTQDIDIFRCAGRVAAVRLGRPIDGAAFDSGTLTLDELAEASGSEAELAGWWLEAVWDLVRLLPEQLDDDLSRVQERLPHRFNAPPKHSVVLGDQAVLVYGGGPAADNRPATVEPHVVFDASAGPIHVGSGSRVHAFTRLVGPCYIGSDVTVMGGDVAGCSIGNVCKIRGEMSNTIVVGHSNKGHDGFIGHSYLGRWVNIGASTVTSNLKNTYGNVALWTPAGMRDTGMQFLGTLFGDHVKTGIGLRLTTGTVLGAGANVYDRMPPKVVAPFSWGAGPPYSTYRVDKFLETARRMMARRHVTLSDRLRGHLAVAHTQRWSVDPESDA